MSQVTTHVLDTARGRPAAGVPVALEHLSAGGRRAVATAETDADGRVGELGDDVLEPGRYALVFDTGAYFASTCQTAFFPQVTLVFDVAAAEHYHVPLLLSPFAFSSYRGS